MSVPIKPGVTGTISADDVRPRSFHPQFILFSLLLTLSMIGMALSIKRTRVAYDSSSKCVLDDAYTAIEKTDGNSTSHSYRVTYRFASGGQTHSGTDEIVSEPTDAAATVYFNAAQPQENSLHPTHWNTVALIWAGIALVGIVLAYWRLPKDYITPSPSNCRQGVGDSGREHLAIRRGKYNSWGYVELAFVGQVVLVGMLVALFFTVFGLRKTEDAVLILAGSIAVPSTLWVYFDRWRCVEAYSSRFCSGIANFSVFFVPAVALVYANYRAFTRLQGR